MLYTAICTKPRCQKIDFNIAYHTFVVSPFITIDDVTVYFSEDCVTATLNYTRNQNYNYSGSPSVSGVDSRPTYTVSLINLLAIGPRYAIKLHI